VELPTYVTLDEAKELKFEIIGTIPESIPCVHCGRELKPIGRRSGFKRIVSDWSRRQECDCENSVSERKKKASEAEKILRENEEADRRAEQRSRIKKLFDQSKLGARFQNRTFEMYRIDEKNKSAFEAAKGYADEFETLKKQGTGLIFTGTKGTGKTHLAAAITIDLIHQGIPVIMGTLISLLGMLKQAYQEKQSEQEIIDLYCKVDLLVIDDLGKEKVTEWVLEKLYLIINSRYENNLPVIITTNSDIDGLTAKLSTERNSDTAEAITSRLWEMCLGVEMDWEDYRKTH